MAAAPYPAYAIIQATQPVGLISEAPSGNDASYVPQRRMAAAPYPAYAIFQTS